MEAGAEQLRQSIRTPESRIPAQGSVQPWIQRMTDSDHTWSWHQVCRGGDLTAGPIWHEGLWGSVEANRHLCRDSSRVGSELQVGRAPFPVRVMLKLAVPGRLTVLARSGWSLDAFCIPSAFLRWTGKKTPCKPEISQKPSCKASYFFAFFISIWI